MKQLSSIYQGFSNLCLKTKREGPILQVPIDCLYHRIFCALPLNDILRSSQVSKKWHYLLQGDKLLYTELLRKKIYHQIFNFADWRLHFGDELAKENEEEVLASLPSSIIDFFKSKSIIHDKKRLREEYLIVWVPKGISINKLEELLHQQNPDEQSSYNFAFQVVFDYLADTPTKKAEWVAIRKITLEKSVYSILPGYKNSGFDYYRVLRTIIGRSIIKSGYDNSFNSCASFEPLFDGACGIRIV